MELDLETFLATLYVIVDDMYQCSIRLQLPPCGAPPALMSDSEVLCLGVAAQWRSGVPWHSERGIIRPEAVSARSTISMALRVTNHLAHWKSFIR